MNTKNDFTDDQVKELAIQFEKTLNKRITNALMPLSYFALVVVIAATFLTYKYYINLSKIEQIESNLSAINAELSESREKIEVLEEKTKPKNIDISLRAYMDEQIKNSPQVRGVDGKMNKER